MQRPEPEPSKSDIAEPTPPKKSPARVRYLGFRTTEDGREYDMRARSAPNDSQLFVVLITHEAFSARWARFQDGPGLCFEKLQRELAADPDLCPDDRLVLARQELVEYRDAREAGPQKRKRRSFGASR